MCPKPERSNGIPLASVGRSGGVGFTEDCGSALYPSIFPKGTLVSLTLCPYRRQGTVPVYLFLLLGL